MERPENNSLSKVKTENVEYKLLKEKEKAINESNKEVNTPIPNVISAEKEIKKIEIKMIDETHKSDINLPNEPFNIFGRMITSYIDGKWEYKTLFFDKNDIKEECFPEENYDFFKMKENSIFIGAYYNEKCIGLAILQEAILKYMYLYDLKVCREYRRCGVGHSLIEKSMEICKMRGYIGLYTQGQDNNLGACLFYLKNGFYIGGLTTNLYKGTSLEGTADIIFYKDLNT